MERRVHGTCRIDAIRSNEQELCTLSQGIAARLQTYNLSACCTEIIVLYHAPCPHTPSNCCREDQPLKYLGLYSLSPVSRWLIPSVNLVRMHVMSFTK